MNSFETYMIKRGGAIIGMNYFARTIQQAFYGYLSSPDTILKTELVFPIIDKTILPMFKIYQATQA